MNSFVRTIREQVTEQIRAELIAGRLPAGQPLREQELANRLGVSRGPVRDAFLQLTQEGFLAYEANCGVTVRELPSGADREFIVSLRRQIEEFVIRQGFLRITADSILKWEEILGRMRAACRSKEVAAIARCDMEFHQTILIAAGGEQFLPIWKWLCARMLLTYSRVDNFSQIVQEHVAIVEAFRARNLRRVLVALKENLK
jgi:DNA-binding GntR family transcriptional regulator